MAQNDWPRCMDAAVRLSDKHILLAAHSSMDNAGDDLLTWDITVASIAIPRSNSKGKYIHQPS